MVGGSSLEGFTVSSANKVMVRRHILLGVRMHGKEMCIRDRLASREGVVSKTTDRPEITNL